MRQVGKDIRRNPRHPFQGTVQISWQISNGELRSLKANCLDMSEQGVCVVCEQPIAARTNVYVRAAAFGLMGNATVRYCRRAGMKHAIGLMFGSAASQAENGRKKFLAQQEIVTEPPKNMTSDPCIRAMTPEEIQAKNDWGTGDCQIKGCSERAAFLLMQGDDWWQYCCPVHTQRFADQYGLTLP